MPSECNAVYGVALNFRTELEALGQQLYGDPYKAPPVAPVLYLRPRNTWNVSGAPIRIPKDIPVLKMAGTVGIIIGQEANQPSGYVAVNDISIPHKSYNRPAIRQRCSDGFCVIGAAVTDRAPAQVRTSINGEIRSRASLSGMVRPIHRLIADINDFLTLLPGDILLIGEPPDAPLAKAGDRVRVDIDGLPPLENEVVPE